MAILSYYCRPLKDITNFEKSEGNIRTISKQSSALEVKVNFAWFDWYPLFLEMGTEIFTTAAVKTSVVPAGVDAE